MIFQRITTSSGIDDFKLIAENPTEEEFIQQLAAAGTLTSINTEASSTISFRALSINVADAINNALVSLGKIGKLNFEVRQNENYVRDLKFISNALPVDLTQYTSIKLQVKLNKSSSGAVVSLTLGSGLTITGDDNNILGISFTTQQTSLLCNSEYYYDLMMSTANSNTYYLEGKLTINRTVTS